MPQLYRVHGGPDAVVVFKGAEGRPDLPPAVFPPDGQEAREVAFVEAVTVVGYEVSYRIPAFQLVDASQQCLNVDLLYFHIVLPCHLINRAPTLSGNQRGDFMGSNCERIGLFVSSKFK